MLNFSFSSDTTAPVCSEVMEGLLRANAEYELGYFEDHYTKKVRDIIQGYFSKPVGIHFCTNGTASNVLAIKIMKHNYSSIITTKYAHSVNYEVGGIEYNTGCKLCYCDTRDGKMTPKMIEPFLKTRGSRNWAYPEIVMLTESTEFGTCYTIEELKEICSFCHENGLYVYIDGARLSNAMVHLNCGFSDILEKTGVDVASFGINKNGAMFGEMLLVLNPEFNKHFILEQKQSMQLFSKSRFMSVQFLAMLENEVWRKNAKNANEMAKYLEIQMRKIGYNPIYKVESNCIFFNFDEKLKDFIKKKYKLSSYEDQQHTRLMTSWSTAMAEVDELVGYIKHFSV